MTREALSQIDEKRYDLEFKDVGIEDVMKLGIAFSGKKVVIKAEQETIEQMFYLYCTNSKQYAIINIALKIF